VGLNPEYRCKRGAESAQGSQKSGLSDALAEIQVECGFAEMRGTGIVVQARLNRQYGRAEKADESKS